MSSSYLIFATFAMAAVTFVTRALPALIPKTSRYALAASVE